MPHIDSKQHYQIQFTSEEFRLVTLALAGKLKDAEDVGAALALNSHLCRNRALSLKNQLEVAVAAAEQAELLENPSTPPTQRERYRV